MLCFLTSVALEYKTEASKACGIITAKEVVARQGDGDNYPPGFKEPLHEGTEFDLLEGRPAGLKQGHSLSYKVFDTLLYLPQCSYWKPTETVL